jgi:hypothetical protein
MGTKLCGTSPVCLTRAFQRLTHSYQPKKDEKWYSSDLAKATTILAKWAEIFV